MPPKPRAQKSAQNSTNEPPAVTMEDLLQMLSPLVQFHKKDATAGPDDMRIYWDVRIVRGEDETFKHTRGTSSLPGALSEKLRANAPALIQQEINDKMAAPLVGYLQKLIETDSFEQVAADVARLENQERPAITNSNSATDVGQRFDAATEP